jgi:hypothetical protein
MPHRVTAAHMQYIPDTDHEEHRKDVIMGDHDALLLRHLHTLKISAALRCMSTYQVTAVTWNVRQSILGGPGGTSDEEGCALLK